MKTSEALAVLYKISCELKGPIVAKDFVSSVVFTVISELIDGNIPVTPEEIERRVVKEAQDLQSCSEANKKSIA